MSETESSLQGFVHSMVRGEDPAVGFPAAVDWRPMLDECGEVLGSGRGLGPGTSAFRARGALGLRESGGCRRKGADIGASFLEVASLGFLKNVGDLGSSEKTLRAPSADIEKSSWRCGMGEETWCSALPHGAGEASRCVPSGDMGKEWKLGITTWT